jgi:hypothetical protein
VRGGGGAEDEVGGAVRVEVLSRLVKPVMAGMVGGVRGEWIG